METMFPSVRRGLPPVPRSTPEPPPAAAPDTAGGVAGEIVDAVDARAGAASTPEPVDAAQEFVSRLRGAAPEFAAAAGAQSAVVREAVPPARHRRSRCRMVLRYASGAEADLTFLGPAGRPGPETHSGFESSIQRWLGTGQHRDAAWLVPDDDAPDGAAVDVIAWAAAG